MGCVTGLRSRPRSKSFLRAHPRHHLTSFKVPYTFQQCLSSSSTPVLADTLPVMFHNTCALFANQTRAGILPIRGTFRKPKVPRSRPDPRIIRLPAPVPMRTSLCQVNFFSYCSLFSICPYLVFL